MEPLKLVKYALDSSISLVNKGEDPTVALEKVSRNLDLNRNYIQRTGELLNVALHYDHFRKHASERASEFPVADIVKVSSAIFGQVPETENEKKASWFVTAEEDIDFESYLARPSFKKTAAQISRTAEKNDSYDTSLRGQWEKAANYLDRLDKEIDELRTEKAANEIQLEALFNSLVAEFKKHGAARESFDDFETSAYTRFGSRAVPYINLVYKAAELDEPRGLHDDKAISYSDLPSVDKLASILSLSSAIREKKAELQEAESFVTAQRTQMKLAAARLHHGVVSEDTVEGCEKLASELDTFLEKNAGPIAKSLIESLVSEYRNAGQGGKSPVFKNTESDNNERARLLQDLIMTDPILAHQDPRKIISAYQQILRLSPQLAKEKEVVRSMLRQLTATQSLHPTEAGQLVEANTNMLRQHGLLHSTEEHKPSKK